MATVRFSKELCDAIKAQAKIKMRPPVDRALATRPDNAWGQSIYDTLFLEVKPLISQLPVGWLNTVNRIKIDKVGDLQCGLEFTFASPQPWPHSFPHSDLAKKDYSYRDEITLKDHVVWSDFKAEVQAWSDRVRAAVQRQDEFVDMVTKVIEAHATLAPALKVWPPLWELIPDEYKDRHREIKVQGKKEVTIDVDLGKLTAMSTAAKFGV